MPTWRDALRRMLELEKDRLERELAELERARRSLAEMNEQPRLSTKARLTWYSAFLLGGPIAIPYYWRIHVWPIPYEPLD